MATDTDLTVAFRIAAGHPAKLAVDVAALTAAMVALWGHHWLVAAVVAILPGLVATAVVAALVRPAGGTPHGPVAWVQLVRVAALVVAVWAAWTHQPAFLVVATVVGAAVLLPFPGTRGPIRPDTDAEPPTLHSEQRGRRP